jgi:hypothetical protein
MARIKTAAPAAAIRGHLARTDAKGKLIPVSR